MSLYLSHKHIGLKTAIKTGIKNLTKSMFGVSKILKKSILLK